jgi:hypothetical protein
MDLAEKPSEFTLICPACLHRNKVQQRFCGLCGFPLKTRESDAKAPVRPTPEPPPVDDRGENAWQWLRERHLQELANRQKRISRWIVLATILLLLALGNAAWLLWRNREQLGVSWLPGPSAASAPKQEALPVIGEEPRNTDVPPAQVEHASGSDEATKTTQEPEPTTAAASTAAQGSENAVGEGAQELLQGRRYLEGQGVPKNSAIAAIWLWKSVARKNVNAVLLLSDLYARGDGVPKSCDQARLLLRVAAQKGSAQARDKLLALPQIGCQ